MTTNTTEALDQLFVQSVLSQEVLYSSAWEKFTGRTSADLQSDWNEVIHPEDLEEFLQVCKKVRLSKVPQQVKFRALDAGGLYHPFLSNVLPLIEDGQVEGICINSLVCHGECHRKLSRYALIKLIVNSLHALVAYVDKSRKYVYVNRAYEDFYQLSCEEIEGQSIENLLGESYARASDHVDKAFEGEAVSFEADFSTSSDAAYHVRMTLVPHLDDGGEVLGCFVLGNPIEAGGVANARFEDLERFLSYWSSNPEGFAHFVGWSIGRLIPHKFHDLFLAIGASFFSLKDICSRIDFLYESVDEKEKLTVRDGKQLHNIATIYKEDGILCIYGSGRRIMLLRDELDGLPYYSLRYFVGDGERAAGYLKDHWRSERGRPSFATVLAASASSPPPAYEEDHMFWNFREADDVMRGVIVYPHSDGFSDPWETKRLGELIVRVSNLKNFDRRLT